MKFRTEISISPGQHQFAYDDQLFFIGSCFTKNIGQKLTDLKFNVVMNPFGVMYNPLSVKNSLDMLMQERYFTADDLHYHNNLWFSFYHHSSFSHTNKKLCLDQINKRMEHAVRNLEQAKFLFITLGTSYVYQLKETGAVVSNCHKLPAKAFRRSMVPSCEIYDELALTIKTLRNKHPELKIVLTLSPVRHLKDGFAENMHSKANLLVAIHQLVDFIDDVIYFPAYEIMMDDLRDYRFYNDDLVHPNTMAVDYIWNKFKQTFIKESAFPTMKSVQEIMEATKHRTFNRQSKKHQEFIQKQLQKIESISAQQVNLDFDAEIAHFKSQIV